MEQPNFFGLSIAYDPYKRELVDGKTLTPAAATAAAISAVAWGLCSDICLVLLTVNRKIREDNEIHNDYDFFRPVIRVQISGWRMVSPGDER